MKIKRLMLGITGQLALCGLMLLGLPGKSDAQPQSKAIIFAPEYIQFGFGGSFSKKNLPTGNPSLHLSYEGAQANYTQTIYLDENGEIKFFTVDNFVYNSDGYAIGSMGEGTTEVAVAPFGQDKYVLITSRPDGNKAYAKAYLLDFTQADEFFDNLNGKVTLLSDFPEIITPNTANGIELSYALVPAADGYALFINDTRTLYAYLVTENGIIHKSHAVISAQFQAGINANRTELEAVFTDNTFLVAGTLNATTDGTNMFIARFGLDLLRTGTTQTVNVPAPGSPGLTGVFTGLEFSRDKRVVHFITTLPPYLGYVTVQSGIGTYYNQDLTIPSGINYASFKN
ncbi:MAG: hypothetical protein V4616_11740, partial [Bacteroidota bacterium]